MTPKEKAEYLTKKMAMKSAIFKINDQSKECAIIAVDELIKESSSKSMTIRFPKCNLSDKEYWQEVRKEIENL